LTNSVFLLTSKETHLNNEEMLAARAQDHLVLKDKRIFQSLAQAAQKKVRCPYACIMVTSG
jgi:hypothetical protein